jgi:hypothetical protein
MVSIPAQRRQGPCLCVVVEDSEVSLDAVGRAAREAVRRGVPLELVPAAGRRARELQLLDAALQRARAAAPGLEVRVPLHPRPEG